MGMALGKACDEIQAAWDEVSSKWTAEVKAKYFAQIYLPLLSEADEVYLQNQKLEDYAGRCLASLKE